MNKAELKAKWAKYCDTDKLVDDMRRLLSDYLHRNSEQGVCAALDTFFTNKEPLIKLLATSKNYKGDLRIITKQPFERQPAVADINSFFSKVSKGDLFNTKKLLQHVDDKGKTMMDYLSTGKTQINIDALPKSDEQEEKINSFNHFHRDYAALLDSAKKYECFKDYMKAFSRVHTSSLQSDMRDAHGDAPILKAGTKTSRAFNQVCQHFGVDKLAPYTNDKGKTVYPYNKVFAEYSDLVSDLVREMYFIISVNPLDYLMMSVGINWQSCHHIGHGSYKGGCMSYMLDGTSMITFVVDNMDKPIHLIPRIYRQMFHYHDNLFVQNRLYPQGNDGATDLYTKFRGFVTDEFADLLHVENRWNTNGVKGNHIINKGTHYFDYLYNASCRMFYPAEKPDAYKGEMTIGHNGICLDCGKEYTSGSRFSHHNLLDCD